MKSLKIQIPNMLSAHCQMRVTNVLKAMDGISINSMEPGVASISLDTSIEQNEAIQAIEKAGYRVGEVDSTSNGSSCCAL